MLLKFMTMNTEDENRDEIEAQEVGITFLKSISMSSTYSSINAQAARMTVKLDGDIIMGEIAATADKRYLNPQYGSLEDMGLVRMSDKS